MTLVNSQCKCYVLSLQETSGLQQKKEPVQSFSMISPEGSHKVEDCILSNDDLNTA